jgi:arabinan endo-1,5-alpha-L-arabinosidase
MATYHLYYSVSSFGSRNSAIGLATTRTLDPSSPEYRWTDEGMVLRSYQEKDDWNAIDPNLVLEGDRAWLVWGSFWGGIKMRRVDPSSGKLSGADETMHSLSSRPREQPINGSVEAPFIVRHGDYWYLFVSFDRCCRGAESTYNVVVAARGR